MLSAAQTRDAQRSNQQSLKSQYDYIVCGSGSSGSVVARRLSENGEYSVLLVEAGGPENIDVITNAAEWPKNLGSERSWRYQSEPNAQLNGRTLAIDAGKVLGGGSSINVMTWAQGHPADWDFFASESGNADWGSQSVRNIYRQIEDWQGQTDREYRGEGGPVYIEPAKDPSPLAFAMLEGASSMGIPTFPGHNGRLMEAGGGCSLLESCLREGKRQSIYRCYIYPISDQPNLHIAPSTLVTQLVFEGSRVVGIKMLRQGEVVTLRASKQVVLCLGAIQTPKVLMQSGIGDSAELKRLGIAVKAHLPGVGRNYQDHVAMDIVWELKEPLQPRNAMCEALVFWKSELSRSAPDILGVQVEVPLASPENLKHYKLPAAGWGFFCGNMRPSSRGNLRLTGSAPQDPIQINANALAEPEDLQVARASIRLFREIGNSVPLARYSQREVAPGPLQGLELDNFIRNASRTFYHQSCTAKMGQDEMSVVDDRLKVYGIDGLRIADASIMPRITTGNTMAPCVVIGELAARYILAEASDRRA